MKNVQAKSLFALLVIAAFAMTTPILQAQDNSIRDAEYLITAGNFQKAVDILDVYIEQHPNEVKAYITRAIANGNMGRVDAKKSDLQFARLLNPYALMYISDSYRSIMYDKKKYTYNFENLNKEFNTSPVKEKNYSYYIDDLISIHSQDSLITRAIQYLSNNDLKNTEAVLQNIEITSSTSTFIYDIKGLIALKRNRLQEAISLFSKCIEDNPSFSLAYHNRAIAYQLLGRFEEASNDLEIALSLNEDISVFYFTFAKLSEITDNQDDAEKYYEMALALDPKYTEARTNYSLLQKTLGNYSEVMLELQNIARKTDNPTKSMFIKGGIHLTYGEYEEAINAFDKYLSENANDPEALFNRGLSKILSGSKMEGCQDIEMSIQREKTLNRSEIYAAFCQGI